AGSERNHAEKPLPSRRRRLELRPRRPGRVAATAEAGRCPRPRRSPPGAVPPAGPNQPGGAPPRAPDAARRALSRQRVEYNIDSFVREAAKGNVAEVKLF